MNAGLDLWTLMATIELPPELAIGQGHGKVSWIVRAIWEEHLGWFRFESTTELYNVPPAAVSPDLVELAGGPEIVIARATRHLSDGRPLHALHLAEAALAAQPTCVEALRVKLQATEYLLDRNNRENFSEIRWLEAEAGTLRGALAQATA
jgi:alkyl sulfatase BDS1-like metallo-beta-lactamase superfamily hydrolase